MVENTDRIRLKDGRARPLDRIDRKILGVMTGDAALTYAEIGQIAGLSPPSVHERVKRMKASGVLTGVTARIDPASAGKPFLAFVHVDTDGWGKGQRMMKLQEFPEVEEMHSVAGDTSVVMKVRTASARAFEQFLSQLYVLPGMRATKSYVVLATYLERPVQAQITADWPKIPMPQN